MANIGTLTAQLTLDASRMRKGLAQSKTQMGQFVKGTNTGIGSITSSVVKLGGAFVAMGGALAAFRMFKDITKVGEDFEQTITTTGAVMRATAEDMMNLNDVARTMGETTEFTATQAAGGLKFLGMAGFEATKAIAALPGVLDLATASGVALERSADIASNALTAMRLPVEQLSRVNDVFVGTITRTNTDMEQLAQAFKFSAPVAAAYGYEIEELSGLIGMLGNAGVQGSMAGTQLAQAFIEAGDIAKKFGFESSDLVDVLDSLKERFGENANMMDFFTKRSGRAALVLSAAGGDVREFQKTLEGVGGEAKIMADKMRATFGGMRKELVSVIESIKIDAFDLYRDSLKDTMEDTIKWLRTNKREILLWVNAIIIGFKEVWSVVSTVVEIAAKFVSGVTSVYMGLELQSAETTNALIKDSERLREAFKPTSIEPWQKMLNATENMGKATVDVLLFVAKAVGITVGGLVKSIVGDFILNVLEAVWDLAGVLERLSVGDFSGAGDKAVGVFTNLADIITDVDKTAGSVMDSLNKEFDAMVEGFDFRSVMDKITDAEFNPPPIELVFLGPELPPNFFAKPVSGGIGDDGSGELKAAQKAAASLLDVRITLLQDMLEVEGSTKEARMAIWEQYKAARIEQMKIEHAALLDMGVEIGIVTATVAARMAELNAEQQELFTEQAGWLKEWATELSEEMNNTFNDMFFDTMKGEWKSLTEYMTGIWDVFLRKIADSAANELSGIFDGDDGIFGAIGNLFGGGDIPALAGGGIVNRPTLAMVGEGGPEAVIPLGKMRDENFLDDFNDGDGSGGNVSITVQTPDLPSFQRSQQQILTQTAIALKQARMRNS